MTMNDLIYVFFLCTHNSASLGLFPSAPARVHSNIDIDIDIDINTWRADEGEGRILECIKRTWHTVQN